MKALEAASEAVAGLACWQGPVAPEPLDGATGNRSFVVRDGGERYFVRCGEDIPMHGQLQSNALQAATAAAALGLAPAVLHREAGILVTRFIDGKTFTPTDLGLPGYRREILSLIVRCHREMPGRICGPAMIFWVFHVIRDHVRRLGAEGRCGARRLQDLSAKSQVLEAALGPVEIVFGHNDLRAGHFIDDGERLWLVGWEEAGFNAPLFDLASLASDNAFDAELEEWFLGGYHQRIPDAGLWRRYRATVCASLLRRALGSLVADLHAPSARDSRACSDGQLKRFEEAYEGFQGMGV